MDALRSHLKLICHYEFYSLPNKEVSRAKDHGKNYQGQISPIPYHTPVLFGLHALRSYFKLLSQDELQSLANQKVSSAKGHSKN